MKLIPVTEAHKLPPKQWVNIYEISLIGTQFYDCCQIADLDLDDPSEYGLELIEEERVLSQGEALK